MMTKERKKELMMAILASFQLSCPDNLEDQDMDDIIEWYGTKPPTLQEWAEFMPFLHWVLRDYDITLSFAKFLKNEVETIYEEFHNPKTQTL